MSLLTTIPEALSRTISWQTDIYVSRNGTEQRVCTRDVPRDMFSVSYLADSDASVQYWKGSLIANLGYQPWFPLWHEAVSVTVDVVAGDTSINVDTQLMDNNIGADMLLLHPDGITHEVIRMGVKTPLLYNLLIPAVVSAAYPRGTLLVPLESVFLENSTGYTPMVNVAAAVQANLTTEFPKSLVGRGAAAIPTHQPNTTIQPNSIARNLLERRPFSEGQSEVFTKRMQKIDYGGRLKYMSSQAYANIVSGRSYKIRDAQERQFWKSFLDGTKGSQKSFYTATYRDDMTITPSGQPAQGGTSFVIKDDCPILRWVATNSHSELAVETADGTTQYVTMNPATTVDNNNGTYTVGFLPALTNTPAGSEVLKISFLELVRIEGDVVTITYGQSVHTVALAIRTVEE